MNTAWLLKSSTLWTVLAISGLVSTAILLLSPDGLPSIRKRESERLDQQYQLLRISDELGNAAVYAGRTAFRGRTGLSA